MLLAAGEFEQAKQLAQKAMDLAVQVGSAQTAEAKKAQEAKKQAEQAHTQVVPWSRRRARPRASRSTTKQPTMMRQADALRAELAQKTKESDAAITQGKEGVNRPFRPFANPKTSSSRVTGRSGAGASNRQPKRH
jgi:hypothetical protein